MACYQRVLMAARACVHDGASMRHRTAWEQQGRAIMTWGQRVCPEGQRGAAGGTDLRPSQGTLEEEERPSRPAGVIAPYGPASRRRRTLHPLQFYQGH